MRVTVLVFETRHVVGSISAAFSSPVYVPPREERDRERSAGFYPEQRLVIEPRGAKDHVSKTFSLFVNIQIVIYSTLGTLATKKFRINISIWATAHLPLP